MKIKLGLWLLTIGMKVARLGIKMSGIKVDEVETNQSITIHNVLDGPYTQMDLGYEWDGPQEAEAYLVVKLEYNNEINDVEWYFSTLDEAYVWVKHFKTSIDPIVIQNGDTHG